MGPWVFRPGALGVSSIGPLGLGPLSPALGLAPLGRDFWAGPLAFGPLGRLWAIGSLGLWVFGALASGLLAFWVFGPVGLERLGL